MLTTDEPWTAARTPAAYQLRLHGGTEDERLITSPPGKHSVGSGPRCQIRLTTSGVQAMECLVVRDKLGLRVRRWSDRTLLNGGPFEEAMLAPGDVLSIGPVQLEILGPAVGDSLEVSGGSADESWESGAAIRSACEAIDNIFLIDEGSSQVLQPTEPNHDWIAARPTTASPSRSKVEAVALAAQNSVTKSTLRRRSRRALDALRKQRRDHDELIAKVNELERMLGEALSEAAARPEESAAAAAADENTAGTGERVAILEGELASFREQLGARDGELQQARYSIDVLERQLIDSQHTMHAFADERSHWEEQFNEIESRLAKYVERIQELECQLEAAPERSPEPRLAEVAPSYETGIDWKAETALGPDDAVETAAEHEFAATGTAVAEEPEKVHGDELTGDEVVEEPATEVSESTVETVVEPELELTADSANAAANNAPETPNADAPAGDAPVDEALDHLRGLSIWREEPAQNTNEHAANAKAAEEASGESSGGPQPVSFLDRYAHMFPDDGAATPKGKPEDSAAPLTEAAPPPEVHADEESVEQYMAKLLARMRGGPADSSVSTSNELPTTPAVSQDSPVASEPREPAVQQPMFTNLAEMKTRAKSPEHAGDMAAMRALANQSARHAIGVHAARKLRRAAITRVIVTALAASVSVYLLLNSSTWQSLSFAAGVAAGFAAVYWGLLTMGTLLKGFQLGAFDDYEEEMAPENSVNPPLPIDVEQAPTEKANTTEPGGAKELRSSEPAGSADVVEVSKVVAETDPV
jgi:hypothetical protein